MSVPVRTVISFEGLGVVSPYPGFYQFGTVELNVYGPTTEYDPISGYVCPLDCIPTYEEMREEIPGSIDTCGIITDSFRGIFEPSMFVSFMDEHALETTWDVI